MHLRSAAVRRLCLPGHLARINAPAQEQLGGVSRARFACPHRRGIDAGSDGRNRIADARHVEPSLLRWVGYAADYFGGRGRWYPHRR